eukprot:5923679-Amphidinium_carterae.1
MGHHPPVMFDPKRFHAVEPCFGSRLSVVFFTPTRLHALDGSHWTQVTQLQKFGFPCKQLAKLYNKFQLDHVCCNAWFQDLDEAVPSSNLPSLADVTHEWERHHRQGHLT